jgi:hypothetical protein
MRIAYPEVVRSDTLSERVVPLRGERFGLRSPEFPRSSLHSGDKWLTGQRLRMLVSFPGGVPDGM